MLLSYWLFARMELLKSKYRDHLIRFAIAGDPIPDDELIGYTGSEFARMGSVTENFEGLLLGPAQETAMGRPGEPGDPELIEHLADRLIAIYEELLNWAYRLRSAAAWSEEGRRLLRALADYANQPIDEIRRFVHSFRDEMDGMNAILESGESVTRSETITFVIPEDVSSRYLEALEAFKQYRQ